MKSDYYKPLSVIVDCQGKGSVHLKQYTIDQGTSFDQFKLKIIEGKKLAIVVGGGMSAEREVSYMSSNGIVNAMIELGYQVIFVDMGADIALVLQKIRPSVVYNALHGTYGEDGCLSGLLNILRIPYTGPGVLASAIAMNKKKSHEIFLANSINVAESMIVHKSDNIKQDPMPRPYVIKPLSQGSSLGVEVIFAEDDFDFADYNFPYGEEIIVEKYIKGQEIQVAVLNGKALGAMEIKMLKGKRFYDYETKYTDGFAQHIYPASIAETAYSNALSVAEKACEIFGCKQGIIRVEFLYNEHEDKLYMLELNTHPGMTPLSICPEIASYNDMNYVQLTKKILEAAKYE